MADSDRRPYVCTLNPETLEKAKRELNEDPDTRQEKIDELREKFRKEKPEVKLPPDDAFLVRFLRNKKFEVDRAYKTILHYYDCRRKYPQLFQKYRPSSLKHIYDLGLQRVCPGRDSEGRKVLVTNLSNFDPDRYDANEVITAYMLSMEKILEDEETQVHGLVLIGDYEGMTMKMVTKAGGPTSAKMRVDVFVNGMPIRMKAIHYIRQPEIFETVFSMIRHFIPKKIYKRIHFHGSDYGTLHKHVPSSMLPTDFGGPLTDKDYDFDDWYKKLMQCDAEFERLSQYGFPKISDTLGGQTQGADPTLGLVGSFKKLET
ncbi:alpha-tocopherol transfer protein-like [Glandiceps talaboti]